MSDRRISKQDRKTIKQTRKAVYRPLGVDSTPIDSFVQRESSKNLRSVKRTNR